MMYDNQTVTEEVQAICGQLFGVLDANVDDEVVDLPTYYVRFRAGSTRRKATSVAGRINLEGATANTAPIKVVTGLDDVVRQIDPGEDIWVEFVAHGASNPARTIRVRVFQDDEDDFPTGLAQTTTLDQGAAVMALRTNRLLLEHLQVGARTTQALYGTLMEATPRLRLAEYQVEEALHAGGSSEMGVALQGFSNILEKAIPMAIAAWSAKNGGNRPPTAAEAAQPEQQQQQQEQVDPVSQAQQSVEHLFGMSQRGELSEEQLERSWDLMNRIAEIAQLASVSK